MDNIDIQANLELVATIVLVAAFVATFFKKTKSMPETPVETVPQNVETPVVPAVVVEVAQAQGSEVAETSAISTPTTKTNSRKPAAKKAPVAKKAPAKKKPVVK